MGKTLNTGLITNAISQDASNNIAIGGAVDAAFKLKVFGASTLTGALSGTSGSFSSTMNVAQLNVSAISNSNYGSLNAITNAFAYQEYKYNSTAYGYIGQNSAFLLGASSTDLAVVSVNNLIFGTGTSFAERMRISSTGAATFSSSVTMGSGSAIIGANNGLKIGYDNLGGGMYFADGNNLATFKNWRIATSYVVGGDLSFTPSTTNGGTTFSTPALTILSNGNVGIGTPTANQKLSVVSADNTLSAIASFAALNLTQQVEIFYGGIKMGGTNTNVDLNLASKNAASISFSTDSTPRMTITSGGDVLVGSTSTSTSSAGVWIYKTSVNAGRINIIKTVTGTHDAIANYHNGAYVGGVVYTDTTTSFPTSSDYRLKQDFKDYNGLDLISAIKTYDYEWKSDKTRAYGVIAHEFEEILPYAVRGEKDGEDMQGVDYSKIVPVLVKAIQELNAKIEELRKV